MESLGTNGVAACTDGKADSGSDIRTPGLSTVNKPNLLWLDRLGLGFEVTFNARCSLFPIKYGDRSDLFPLRGKRDNMKLAKAPTAGWLMGWLRRLRWGKMFTLDNQKLSLDAIH